MGNLLDTIKSPSDIKKLSKSEILELCSELRELLINSVSKTGGHLSSNLGVVELTVMLLYVFDLDTDNVVFDVGHQTYVYKILTGRKDLFHTLRQFNGLSGFPSPKESKYDLFTSGHSSTSISAALGLAKAASIKGIASKSIAVIGDGAITGGLAYEGLINAGRSKEEIIVILNDNEMSISKNVGGMAKYLSKIRNNPSYFKAKDRIFNFLIKIPKVGQKIIRHIMASKTALKEILYHQTMFENMGFTYLGPVDGHNIEELSKLFLRAKILKVPVLIHVNTVKGKGYSFAENAPTAFHGLGKFEIETGEVISKTETSFTKTFQNELLRLADNNSKICAVTAAMAQGTGLFEFAKKYPKRFFDVGIAEGHAVTFSAGLAKGGMLPIFAVYSSFMQRAYDQLIHDVSIQDIKVIFAIDRAGLVGEDGKTHQGIYDAAFLNTIQNIEIYSPSNYAELSLMLDNAVNTATTSVAIRYPRGDEHKSATSIATGEPFDITMSEVPSKTLVVTYGRIFYNALDALNEIIEKKLYKNEVTSFDILKLNKIKPLELPNTDFFKGYTTIIFFEEGVKNGGIAESFGYCISNLNVNYYIKAITNSVPQATVEKQMELCKLDTKSMIEFIKESTK
ncbi:MAG: 1-deoxy-D-xylulose-5-phosphate synthase [Clostridia bacterium]